MVRRLLKIQQIKGALLDLFMKSLLSIKKKKKILDEATVGTITAFNGLLVSTLG